MSSLQAIFIALCVGSIVGNRKDVVERGVWELLQEKLVGLLTEFGVEVREKNYQYCDSSNQLKVGGYKEYGKVTGYGGFYTLFEFDEDGKFVQMGAWE